MKKGRVKISVVMPARNAAKTLSRAIRSVLAQEDVLFELLIGDDASKDATLKIARSYLSDRRVKVFHFRKSRGVSVARNRLLVKARGKYISFCDADDLMLPGNLRTLTRILDKNPALGAVYGDLWVKTPRGRVRIKRRLIPFADWDILGGCLAHGGTLIRRSLMRKVGGYRTDLNFLEDCDLFLRLAEQTKLYYHPGKPLYLQKQLPGSLSDRSQKELREVSQKILRDAIQRRYGTPVGW